MSSLSWMPLYVSDYRGDTMHLSAAQHGAYLLLIMHYWQQGGLPDDDEQLARIASMSISEWRRNRPIVRAFFGEGWRHHRIDRVMAEAVEAYEKRSAAGKAGNAKRWEKHRNASRNAIAKGSQPQPHKGRGHGESDLEGVAQGPRLAVVNGGRAEPAIGFDDDGRLLPSFDTAEVPF